MRAPAPHTSVFDRWIEDLERLVVPGVMGRYHAFEATEVIAIPAKGAPPINILSMIVAEDEPPLVPFAPGQARLAPKLLRVSGLKGWTVGLVRYAMPLPRLIGMLRQYAGGGPWAPSGLPLGVGALEPLQRTFVPADGHKPRALNGVLKNNFWGGSHVFELADPDKTSLAAFFEQPPRLQALSEAIRPFFPIEIARASDRLGNVLIQLPVTAVAAELRAEPKTGAMTLNVAWHPGCRPRPLRLWVERRFDGAAVAELSRAVDQGATSLALGDTPGLESAALWDDTHDVKLWSQAPISRVRQITTTMHIVRAEPRLFRHAAGESDEIVPVADVQEPLVVGRSDRVDQESWTRRRLYEAERTRLARERRFVQYTPTEPASVGHAAALADVRSLIETFGQKAAWLWDPYLSAEDVLKTLFHCPHAGADLRALSDALALPGPPTPALRGWRAAWAALRPPKIPPRPRFAEIQRAHLTACGGNLEALRLEFRARVGPGGWSFHDRFLIFPQTPQGPLAWSLGTSVNMLGHKHHILQRVDDGRLVADAFEELWAQLTAADQQIWKTP